MAKTRLMLVDDEEGFTNLLRMNLEKTGLFEVGVENEADSAVDAIRAFKPDVLLLDVVMPGVDGGDIVAQLRTDPELKNLPIIMLTALISREELSPDAVAESENLIMLSKPVNMEMLLKVIEASLGKKA